MEITRNDIPMSQEIDYKKIKSDWDVFNHQQDYDFKRPDKFCSQTVRYAKIIKTMNQIKQLQDSLG